MPDSEEAATATYTLDINAGHAAAEIVLLDSRLERIDGAYGQLKRQAPAGVYQIKVVLGREMVERTILLDHDLMESFTAPSFVSPAPLDDTLHSDDVHLEAARRESRRVHVRHGEGASIFIFARQWPPRSAEHSSRDLPRPGQGFSLMTAGGGRRIADLVRDAEQGPNGEGWAAVTVSVAPGVYTLRGKTGEIGSIDQTVVACPGWQTQVFLLRSSVPDADEDGFGDGWPDIAMLMARDHFGGEQEAMRLAEVARLALTDRRRVLSPEMHALLDGKFENPMLGLYGAHLMILAQKRPANTKGLASSKWPSLNEDTGSGADLAAIVHNLRRMLGDRHPDVEALSLKLEEVDQRTTRRVAAPPMLCDSWQLIVEASNEQPAMLDRRVWRRIERRVTTRPYLSWQVSRGGRSADQDPYVTSVQAHAAISTLPSPLAASSAEARADAAFALGAARASESMIEKKTPVDASDETRRQVSIRLGVPRFAVDDALAATHEQS